MDKTSPWFIPVVLAYPENPHVLIPIVMLTSSRMLAAIFEGMKSCGQLDRYCAALLCRVAENRECSQGAIIQPWVNHDDDSILTINTLEKVGDYTRIHVGAPDEVFESQRKSTLEPGYMLSLEARGVGNISLFTFSERIGKGLSEMYEDGRVPIWLAGVLAELKLTGNICTDLECLGEGSPVYITRSETPADNQLLHLTTEDALLLS